MEKINIAELLKDCPKGMELDCLIHTRPVIFNCVKMESDYPIKISSKDGFSHLLTYWGSIYNCEDAKCVIFPKGKTTWEGFQRPFVDGDIIADDHGNIAIYKGKMWYNKKFADYYCGYRKSDDKFLIKGYRDGHFGMIEELHYATEEEKRKLFQTINDNGYKWNEKTKALEESIKPTFKAGNKIKHKENAEWVCTIRRVEDRYYVDGHPTRFTILFDEQNEYELVQNKFDVNTLKTFDQVLVRLSNSCIWMPKFFLHYDPKVKYYPFVTLDNMGYPQCIPYKGNEHLSRTTDDCNKFYKVWE